MEDSTVKGLDECLMMVRNWRRSYEKYFDENYDGDAGCWDFIPLEMMEDMDMFLMPYIDRFRQLEIVTANELISFLKECYTEVKLLRDHIMKGYGGKEDEAGD